MATPHIAAEPGDFADTVLLPGDPLRAKYIAEKGSICVDGISLTVNTVNGAEFGLNIVPHSLGQTTLGEFRPGRRLLIIGGGYIGLEAAAVARQLGLEVTLLEVSDRILQRVAAAAPSDYFRKLHHDHGVDLRESARLARRYEDGGRVSGAELESGEKIETDLVLVGIGGSPNTALAAAAGLDCDNGICVNQICQTSEADIYAAGDCCNFERNGQRIRLESVQNAADQGDLIARVLAGENLTYTALPWFWSDQYDCKLQIVGLNHGYDLTVVRPGASESSLSVWYYRDGKLLAIDSMNEPRSYAFGRKIIEGDKNPAPHVVADPATDLKALAMGK